MRRGKRGAVGEDEAAARPRSTVRSGFGFEGGLEKTTTKGKAEQRRIEQRRVTSVWMARGAVKRIEEEGRTF